MTDTANTNDKRNIALVPVLGLVLLYVLMGGEDTSGSPPIQLVQQPVASPEHSGPEEGRSKSNRNITWPGRTLHTIVEHNPFELTDPRAILDADFEAYGITEWTQMYPVDATEFLEKYFDDEGDAEPSVAGSGNSTAQHTRDAANAVDVFTASAPPLPVVDLAAVAAAAARRARIEDLQRRILALQNTPVTMIMTSARGRSALLGNRRITEGELMEDGIRAVSISRNGIAFEIIDDTNSH
jgi:hypothetical protein